ncbi:MAG: hypothetical protein Q4D06_03240 [Coriobacteriia bacterium]|nr:hypothetical protein [Coriobacteriia bacterium]
MKTRSRKKYFCDGQNRASSTTIDWAKAISVILVALGSIAFFALCTVAGVENTQTDNGSVYIVYILLTSCLCAVCLIHELVIQAVRLSRGTWILLLVSLAILLDLLIERQSFGSYDFLLFYIGLALPGLAAGLLASNPFVFRLVKSLVDPFVLLVTVAVVLFEVNIYASGWWRSLQLGSFGYQTAAYSAAVAFGLNAWSILRCGHEDRFRIFNLTCFRTIRLALLPILAGATLLSGGRGGAVLVLMYCVIVISWVGTGKKHGIAYSILVALLVVLAGGIAFNLVDVSQFAGLDRILNRGDNRSSVIEGALSLFSESPVFGYGFGGYGQLLFEPYPHNIVLDILLCGGIVGLLCSLLYSGWFVFKIKKIGASSVSSYSLLLVIAVYALTFLMFSGTFLSSAVFWFCLSFVTSYCIRDET